MHIKVTALGLNVKFFTFDLLLFFNKRIVLSFKNNMLILKGKMAFIEFLLIGLHLLLFLLDALLLTLSSLLRVFAFFKFLLELLKLIFLFDKISVKPVWPFLQLTIQSLQVDVFTKHLFNFFFLGLFLMHQLLDSVILRERQTTALLDDLMQVSDFAFEVLDDFAGFFLLVFGLLDKTPSSVYLLL